MTYKEAKAYLQQIADNATLTGYREALCKAIEALEKVERLEEELWKATNNCDFCIKIAELITVFRWPSWRRERMADNG